MSWPLLELRQRALDLARRCYPRHLADSAVPKLPPTLPGSIPLELVKLLELLVTPTSHVQTLLAIGTANDIVLDQHQRSLAERLVRFIVVDTHAVDGVRGAADVERSIDLSPLPHTELELDVVLVRKDVHATITVIADRELTLRQEFLLEQGARLDLRVCQMGNAGSVTRQTTLLGPGAALDDKELVISSQGLELDNVVAHATRGTSANVLQAGIVLDKNVATAGMLRVLPRSQRTESFLAQHWLLLGPNARASAMPMLEIEADDVKASHSATVRPVDEEQLFYLAQRGIARNEARILLAKALLGPVIDAWPAQGREELTLRIDRMLAGHAFARPEES